MKIIAGLGNPGVKYETTRHNVGFIAADLLADAFGAELALKGTLCLYNTVRFRGEKVMIVKPQTFMNLSGECVGQLARYYKVENEDILILADDLSLPVGTMRFRPKGSSGGHNGLKSVIAHLGGDDFPRLKIGIGAADGDVIDHVLGRFSKEEWEKVSSMLELSVDAVKLWLESGSEAVMNRYNVYSRLPKKKKEADDGGKETAKKDVPPLIPLNGKATEER
ncbi:MAG: aminoacyl-tRNA hydrolase [Bacillota bacterium]|jgi:PTH1 family peptidyl-tRNA hydrolase